MDRAEDSATLTARSSLSAAAAAADYGGARSCAREAADLDKQRGLLHLV